MKKENYFWALITENKLTKHGQFFFAHKRLKRNSETDKTLLNVKTSVKDKLVIVCFL